jgi:lipoate-protein ligase A
MSMRDDEQPNRVVADMACHLAAGHPIAYELALDEAFLDTAAEESWQEHLLGRVWEPGEAAVVVGRHSSIAQEVRLDATTQDRVPILRRATGGCAVVLGPGCLCVSGIVRHARLLELAAAGFGLGPARSFLHQLLNALAELTLPLALDESGDWVLGGRKCGGTAVRHTAWGSLIQIVWMCDFDASLAERYLCHPPREPRYRKQRSHNDFLTRLPLPACLLRAALCERLQLNQPAALQARLTARAMELLHTKYLNPAFVWFGTVQR